MTLGPLPRDVVDDQPVVVVGQGHLLAGGRGDVAAVHPRVTGQDHVHEVGEGPLLVLVRRVHRLLVGHPPAAYQPRHPRPASHRLRSEPLELGDDPLRRPAFVLLDLDGGQRVDELTAAALGRARLP